MRPGSTAQSSCRLEAAGRLVAFAHIGVGTVEKFPRGGQPVPDQDFPDRDTDRSVALFGAVPAVSADFFHDGVNVGDNLPDDHRDASGFVLLENLSEGATFGSGKRSGPASRKSCQDV